MDSIDQQRQDFLKMLWDRNRRSIERITEIQKLLPPGVPVETRWLVAAIVELSVSIDAVADQMPQ